jgi:hypothetical protein
MERLGGLHLCGIWSGGYIIVENEWWYKLCEKNNIDMYEYIYK